MSAFEELDYRQTGLGELILRRRQPVSMPGTWVYEVKLDGRFLMSSLVNTSEEALARRALERLDGEGLEILVGGLGLGHTAAAVLDDPRVARVDVVEVLPEVVAWHEHDMVPLAGRLRADPRCRLVTGDAYRHLHAREAAWDAVLIDIDDSPEHVLSDDHDAFYTVAGMEAARRALRPGGVLALWTSLAGQEATGVLLRRVFPRVEVEEVEFHNPLLGEDETNALYFAR